LPSGISAADWIARHARYQPQAEAALDLSSGRRFSYAQFDARITRAASWLAAAYGVLRGDRVAVLSKNDTDVFEIQFACQRLGAIFVPLNWRLAVAELRFICADCGPKLLMYGLEFAEAAHELCAGGVGKIASLANGGASDYERGLAQSGEASPASCAVDLDDIWMIMYTSGTSGRPKGAQITYRMCAFNAIHCAVMVGLTARSRNLVVLPMFHTGGLNIYANPTFHTGGTNVVLRDFEPARLLALLADKALGITHLMGVPTHFAMLAEQPGLAEADLSHLQCIGIGGSPAPRALIEAYGRLGIVLRQGWGMTETGPVGLLISQDMALAKAGSCGLPPPYTELRICDAEGRDVARGETGELLIRGPNVTPGYWNNPPGARDAFTADGWLKTGDAARQDEDGYYYIVDRWKDMFISGGENVYPAEIESVIAELDGIAEVAVIGVTHPKWGEVGRAFAVLKTGVAIEPDEIIDHCRGRLARYKVPREVRLVEALPHTGSGKIAKRELSRE
jgi:fatty-acyl-CoA synthase